MCVCTHIPVHIQSGECDLGSLQSRGAVGEDEGSGAKLPHVHHEQLCVRASITPVPAGEGISAFRDVQVKGNISAEVTPGFYGLSF